jgi:hypothetical protein
MEQGAFYKNFVKIRIQTQKFDYNDNTTGANPHKSAIFWHQTAHYITQHYQKNRISGVFRAFQQKTNHDTANHTQQPKNMYFLSNRFSATRTYKYMVLRVQIAQNRLFFITTPAHQPTEYTQQKA